MREEDTICAMATPSGRGAISVIRVSGPKAQGVLKKICPFLPSSPESHRVYYGMLRGAEPSEILDEVVVAFFEQGRSYTGQDCFEISVHGNPLVVDQVLR